MFYQAILALFVAAASMPNPAVADCTREALLAAADKYVAGQTAGQLGADFKASATNFTYRENNKASSVKTGVLGTALQIASRRTTADTVACASFTELVSTAPKPYVIGTQLRHDAADGMAVTMIDVIAATTGSLRFNAAQTLSYFKAEDWSPLTAAQRAGQTRESLQAVADAYMDMWTNATAIDAVPWGTPCERVEGSARVSPCTGGAPRGGSSRRNSMRRYVIDEEYGSADVQCSFDAVGGVADSHEFRLEGGKLRYVHTITL
jgi:hypothetical protein